MTPLRIFVDSDVIIASLLSNSGASYALLHENNSKQAEFFITDFSLLEVKEVIKRHPINPKQLEDLITKKTIVEKLLKMGEIQKKYGFYTNDINDTHVIAGADQMKVNFLTTFNLRDFKIDLIKKDLSINILRPANILQFLRSIK